MIVRLKSIKDHITDIVEANLRSDGPKIRYIALSKEEYEELTKDVEGAFKPYESDKVLGIFCDVPIVGLGYHRMNL
jgi:hypothetical protein